LARVSDRWYTADWWGWGIEIEVIDASPEFKKKNRKYRTPKAKEPEQATSKEDTPDGEDGEATP